MKYKKSILRLWSATLLAALLCIGQSGSAVGGLSPGLAWWGTLYPKFCFMEAGVEGHAEDPAAQNTIQRPKISFYLAKLLDW
jgi:hypothetical protein